MAVKKIVIGVCVAVVLISSVGLYLYLRNIQYGICYYYEGNTYNPLLIYSSKATINIYDLCRKIGIFNFTSPSYITGVFWDETHHNLYMYSNSTNGTGIYRMSSNNSSLEIIALVGIGTIDKISVDWITGNIYFLDTLYNRIGVCTKSASHCMSIITGEELRGFALNPENGEMYWSNWKPNPRIFRAEMNGKSRAPIVEFELGWPRGLTIDHGTHRIYWMDGKKCIIESMKLDGSDRRLILRAEVSQLSSIAVINNRLFWSDKETSGIIYVNEPHGQFQTLFKEDSEINSIHIYHPVVRQNYLNPCRDSPCDEICLLTADHKYTCACSSDKMLNNDGKTCERINMNDRHLIIAAGGNFYDYHHEILGKPNLDRINGSENFGQVYNSIEQNLSISDNQIIYEQFLRFIDGRIQGIEYDYVGHNLYMVKSKDKRIEVMSLTTLEKIPFQFENHIPRSILLIPHLSTMIVTLCNTSVCLVDNMSMTDDKWREFIQQPFRNSSLGVPLAFDAKRKRVFWADEMGGKIKSMALESDGHGEKVEVDELINPVSVAIIEDDIFWTLRNSKKIFWARRMVDSITRTAYNIKIPGDVDVIQLIAPSTKYYKKEEHLTIHKCRIDNGECSHVCLVDTPASRVCKCPPDMYMNSVPYTTCKA